MGTGNCRHSQTLWKSWRCSLGLENRSHSTHKTSMSVKKQTNNTFPLTTQMNRSPRTSRRERRGRDRTGSRRTGPRCAQRTDVPALGTFRLFLWRTSHQKCTLGEEQSFRVKRRRDGRREGVLLGEGASSLIFLTLIKS